MEAPINVIYSANVDSMDSWDMDNLKYLRKLSKTNPLSEKDMETMSYVSRSEQGQGECFIIKDTEELLDSAIYSKNGNHFLKKSIRSGRRESQTRKEVILTDLNNNVIVKPAKGPHLDRESLIIPTPLDDCYVMDVLMVRNESVLTDRTPQNPSCPSKSPDIELAELVHESEILRVSSPSLSISSDDSFTSAIEKGFFDMDDRRSSHSNKSFRRKPPVPKSEVRIPPSNKPLTSPIRHQSMPDECPFCGGCGKTGSFYSRKSKKSDLEELMRASIAPTIGGEPPPIDLPKTPSPYYVRLRKDLIASNSPPLSLNKPKNFQLDKQGQLVIDYSPNWESLESYVQSLKSS